jgi:hypothetical protein
MLTILINRAKEDGQVGGVVPHLVDGGLSFLQYLFMKHYLEQARNMKLLLYAFEQASGLKINFHKSEVYYFGEASEVEAQYNELFGCKFGYFSMIYFEISINFRKLRNEDRKR